jgi:sarcosine oxidase
MQTFDAIVLGSGGVGSAALFHLAQRGLRALAIDRFPPGHDRGSSHGQTRIIRQAYSEHPNYVPMALRGYELWHELEARRGEQLLFPVGLVQIGPPDGEVLPGTWASARAHGLELETISRAEMSRRFPGFNFPEPLQAVLERSAGYLLVERCVVAHAEEAVRLGARLQIGETVKSWRVDQGIATVETDRDRYRAECLIVAAGAWASDLLGDLGIALQVRRKPLYWRRPQAGAMLARPDCPTFLYEVPGGVFYGFPQIDDRGVKVAEHTGGTAVDDPLALDRQLDRDDEARVAQFCRQYLPELAGELLGHAVCMYTMTPDAHFVVDRHPRYPNVAFAAGLSGHGFKFTGMLGEALVDLLLTGKTRVPMEFLACTRPALRRTAAHEP